MILNNEDCRKLEIACSIVGGLFTLSLFLVIHNVSRYLYRLKITESLIVLFYIGVIINNIGNMVEYFLKASDP